MLGRVLDTGATAENKIDTDTDNVTLALYLEKMNVKNVGIQFVPIAQ